MTAALHPADLEALDKILKVEPLWRGLRSAGEAVGLEREVLLHAGPAFPSPEAVTAPVLNSAAVAVVFEGLADDLDGAAQSIRAGEITLRPAQDRGVVTPLAAVVSRSMVLQAVVDGGDRFRVVHAPINGGGGSAAPRLGLRTAEALDHQRWLNGPFAETLAAALDEDIPLIPLAAHGLSQGDDCHGRTPAATAGLTELLAPRLGTGGRAAEARAFLEAGPSFFLNLWMAASKCILAAAVGTTGSSLVTGAGANGAASGIQVAGLPGRWFAGPAAPPAGDLGGLPITRALGAIGDSAIVDVLGFGAMAMSYAPEQKQALSRFLPVGGLDLPGLLLGARHPGFGALGLRVGLPARAVVGQGRAPVISLGILDRQGTAGRLGGGIFVPPLETFRAALAALEATS
jgi:hypothetical protein